MEKLKIYGIQVSRAFRALWAAEEAEVEYESILIDFAKGEHRGPEFLKMNPNGKVPVLKHGSLVIYESAAIVSYISSLAPEKNMVPLELDKRAVYDQWMFYAMSEFEQPLWASAKHQFALPKELRVPQINKTAIYEFGKALAVVEEALKDREFILGEKFSAADILIGHCIMWARKREGFRDLEMPIAHEYVKRLRKRRAYQVLTNKISSSS